MNHHDPGCRLTSTDYAALRVLARRLEDDGSPLLPLLHAKLAGAAVVADERIDPLVATLNSRVEFRLDDRPLQTRILVGCAFRNGLVGLTLPVSTPYGLALLGMRQGRTVRLARDGGAQELHLSRIVYQPQAAARLRRPANTTVPPGAGSADIIDLARARKAAAAPSRRVSQ